MVEKESTSQQRGDDTQSRTLREETTEALDQYNPISTPVEIDSQVETMATIESVQCPSQSEILSKKDATIEFVLSHSEVSGSISMPVLLDRFLPTVYSIDSNQVTLTSVLEYLSISRAEINKLESSKIPVYIERNCSGDLEATAAFSNQHVISSDDIAYEIEKCSSLSEEIKPVYRLWMAQSDGHVRVFGAYTYPENENVVVLEMEIPWCDRVQEKRFSVGTDNNNLPPLKGIMRYILGREPLCESEYENIVGNEIPASYRGEFTLDEPILSTVEDSRTSYMDLFKSRPQKHFRRLFGCSFIYG